MNISSSFCFQIFWVYTLKWNWQIIHSLLQILRSCPIVFHSGSTTLLYCFLWWIMGWFIEPPILFIHSPFGGHFTCFYLLAIVSSTAMDVCVQFFGWTSVCSSLGSVSRSGVVEPYDNCILIFLRIYQTIVHTGCTIFYLYKQCLRVPISLHCCQHLIFFFLLL